MKYFKKKSFQRPVYVKKENDYGFKRNENIKAPFCRLIDEEGVNLGEVTTAYALSLAKERGFDLIEIAALAKPPVCKLLEWEKFRYEQQKKQNETKGVSRNSQKQHVSRFTPLIGQGDYQHRIDRIIKWSEEKHTVKVEIRINKRNLNPEIVKNLMNRIREDLKDKVKIDSDPKMEGRNFTMLVLPK